MSMAFCPHCDTMYDQDFNVEHEEECTDEKETDDSFYGQAREALMEAGLTDDEAEAMIDDFLT